MSTSSAYWRVPLGWGGSAGLNFFSYSASGGDGKYETYQGTERVKWNNYQKTVDYEQATNYSCPWYTASGLAVDQDGSRGLSPYAFPDSELLECLGKLSSAVKGSDFNLAVCAAQGNLAVKMVVDALSSFGRAFLALKRGDFGRAARCLGVNKNSTRLKPNDLAGRWLELQYGWLPLMSDCHEAFRSYEALTSRARVLRYQATRVRKGTWDGSTSPVNFSVIGQTTRKTRIICELTEQLSNSRILGLTDPLSVAWEVIPYSFCVDWFIPVGNYLEALNIVPKLKGRFLTTRHNEWSGKFQPSPPGVGDPDWERKGIECRSKVIRLSRVYSTGLDVPAPSFKPLSKAMSPKHVWNAIALATQRFSH